MNPEVENQRFDIKLVNDQWGRHCGALVKLILGLSTSHIRATRDQVQATPFPIQLPTHSPGRQQMMDQVLVFLPPTLKVQMEFLIPGFNLAPVQAFVVMCAVNQQEENQSLLPSLFLSVSLCLSNK